MNEAYDMNELNSMRDQIENMSKFNQLEILRILTKNKDVIINENKYGIHINLSDIDISILKELTLYIKYVQKQESFLNNTEEEKERYKNIFFVTLLFKLVRKIKSTDGSCEIILIVLINSSIFLEFNDNKCK